MCDVCRGRHRVYATTKRAKRKMEKAAVGLVPGQNASTNNGQQVTWMPPQTEAGDGVERVVSTSTAEVSSHSFVLSDSGHVSVEAPGI
jgi:hypothetical protein